ncbi:MAG: hypothetical protein ACI4RI_00700 [Ruminococcus sp.]
MTRLLSDIFDNCSPSELDLLLEDYDEELADEKSLDRIMSMTLGKAGITKSTRKMGRNTKTLVLIAACVSMIVAMTVGSFVAEALEYNKAVEYLKDNNISIKGLSREDIKNVYRSIITDSYTYRENSKVTDRNTYVNSVQGYNIAQNNISNSMSNANYIILDSENTAETDEFYSFDVKGEKEEWITDEKGYEYYIDSIESSYIVKYVDGSEVWEAEFKEFKIDDYIVVENGVLVYGKTPVRYDGKGWVMWSAFIDNDGKVMWKKKLDAGFHHNYIAYARENRDGSFLVVSCSDNDISDEINPPKKLAKNKDKDNYMVIYNLDSGGKIISTTANMGECFQIDIVLKSGENYIAELYYMDSDDTKFVKLNKEGEILKSFNLNSKTDDYEFVDMVEFNGKLYLSATARSGYSNINEIKEGYTSVLLVCDYDSGRPKEFYSAKCSFAGKLFVNNNRELKWSIDSIISAEYSPYTSSYSVAGEKRTKTYTFDKTGVLLYETRSNKIERFTSY